MLTRTLANRSSQTYLCKQEAGSKEIELQEDDPDAMMALLHFLYDIPYQTDATKDWARALKSYAEVYVVAEKYQIGALKSDVFEKMQEIITSDQYLETEGLRPDGVPERLKNKIDFIDALRIIYAGTPTEDTQARKMMLEFLIQNINFLRKEVELLSLLRVCPDLGADIIGHPDLDCEANGYWRCDNKVCKEARPECGGCDYPFEAYEQSRYRHEEAWQCPSCDIVDPPVCNYCSTWIQWKPRSVPGRLNSTP